jgi:hypothetical protein
VDWILNLLKERSIPYVTFEEAMRGPDDRNYDFVLRSRREDLGVQACEKPANDRGDATYHQRLRERNIERRTGISNDEAVASCDSVLRHSLFVIRHSAVLF